MGRVGIGIKVRQLLTGQHIITELVPGSAAANSPLEVGEVIQSVNGTDCSYCSTDHLADLLLGPEGSVVNVLTIARGGRPKSINLERGLPWDRQEEKKAYKPAAPKKELHSLFQPERSTMRGAATPPPADPYGMYPGMSYMNPAMNPLGMNMALPASGGGSAPPMFGMMPQQQQQQQQQQLQQQQQQQMAAMKQQEQMMAQQQQQQMAAIKQQEEMLAQQQQQQMAAMKQQEQMMAQQQQQQMSAMKQQQQMGMQQGPLQGGLMSGMQGGMPGMMQGGMGMGPGMGYMGGMGIGPGMGY